MVDPAADPASSLDLLLVALTTGASALIVGVVSVGAQLWIARRARKAETDRRTDDREAEDARRNADRAQAERDAVLARREPHYAAALSAVSEFREQIIEWRALVLNAVTHFEFREGLDAGFDMRHRIGKLDPSIVDHMVNHSVTELPKAATRYTEVRSFTLGALLSARTVGSKSVRDAAQKFTEAAFAWTGGISVPGWRMDVQTGKTTEIPRSKLAIDVLAQLDKLSEAARPLEQALRAELGYDAEGKTEPS